MELRHLRYFVAVAEAQHFGRAAERLGIKQPPLSAQIRQLEEELGTPLFRRETRGVTLTEAGEVLLVDARRILAETEQAKVDVARRARGQTGELHIGFAGGTPFPPLTSLVMKTYRDRYPDVEVTPRLAYTAELVEHTRTGGCDLAIVWEPLPSKDDLAIHRLHHETIVAVLPDTHRLAGRPSLRLEELAQDKLIILPRDASPSFYDEMISSCRRAGFSPRLGATGPSVASFVGMVGVGLGVALAPQSITQIHTPGVAYVPVEGEAPALCLALIHRRDNHAATVREFVAVARKVAAEFGEETALAPA